jgi:hypothetical protein
MWTWLGTTTLLGAGALLLVSSFVGQENHPSPSSAVAEQEALKVLNDSDFARTVTPTLQDAPCTYEHPAFPGLFPPEKGALIDATGPAAKDTRPVRPDQAEYLIRFQSAKPVQFAVQQLLTLGDKWNGYAQEAWPVSETEGPTDLARGNYNPADMIAIAVILKHGGPDGTSLFDYAYGDNGRIFSSLRWPCAGLRTSNGQTFAHTLRPWAHQNTSKVMVLFFPRLVDGKPLISGAHEKVEFRMVLKQRVFEATFYVNGDEVLDGSERVLYLPNAVTDLTEVARE